MRDVYLAHLDKPRPCLILTRTAVLQVRDLVTVAGITSTIRGTSAEVRVGAEEGVHLASVVNCDNIQTISVDDLIRPVGIFSSDREPELAAAVMAAFDLDPGNG